ncbi:hypothetical protein P8452_28405 [Trifolium repens]|nr:hypothetical protein P8452_28405 [Trifolium repens]
MSKRRNWNRDWFWQFAKKLIINVSCFPTSSIIPLSLKVDHLKNFAYLHSIWFSITRHVSIESWSYRGNVDSFARGVGLVSLPGDKSDGDREIDDLKLLYRAYVTNALASGHMQDNKYGFTKREKKKGFLKSLKILYVKKMSQRQKGMQNSLGKPPHW